MKTSKALHFCALQPNAKQWNHQSRLRSPVKLHQLEQLVATKVSHHLVCMCIRFLYCFYEIDWKCWYFCLANQFLFDVFCLSCLHRSWPVLLTRHWWQSHRAPNAKEYAPGGHLIVRQWSLLNAGSVSMGIYGVYLLSIYHICICCGCVNIYIYIRTYYIHIYIYTLDCIIIIYGCIILILCTCCTFIHVDRVHVKYTFNVSSGISHLFVYVQNIKLACVTLLFWTLQSNNRVALAKHTNTLDSLELYNKDPHNGFLLSLYTI